MYPPFARLCYTCIYTFLSASVALVYIPPCLVVLHLYAYPRFCPNAMHGKLELLSAIIRRSTQLCSSSFSCMQCFRVSMPPAVRFILFYDKYIWGSFNVRTHLGVCRKHKVGSCKNKSAHRLTRRDTQTGPHSAPPRDRTQGIRI